MYDDGSISLPYIALGGDCTCGGGGGTPGEPGEVGALYDVFGVALGEAGGGGAPPGKNSAR